MEPPTDFRRRTFLERISLAAREPVYSAALGWLFDEQSPLPLSQRLDVISALSDTKIPGCRTIEVTTEWNDIDVLLSIQGDGAPIHVAIENKIKAAEGQEQLAAYDQQLGALPGTVKKVFLTLAGDLPSSGVDWIPASYSRLLSAVRAQPASSNAYVADLCDALGRLVALADAARIGTAGVAAAAFNDEDASFESDAAEYIADMRLNKVASVFGWPNWPRD